MNREQRYALAHRALESSIEENAEGKVILVEGKRDEIALRDLGFTGPIEKLNRGWTVDRVVVYIVENYGRSLEILESQWKSWKIIERRGNFMGNRGKSRKIVETHEPESMVLK